jgi:hypothetical protein
MLKKLKQTPPIRAFAATLFWGMVSLSQANESLALAANAEESVPTATSTETLPAPNPTTPAVETKVEVPAVPAVVATEATPSVSDAVDKAERDAQKASITAKVRNPTLQKHLLENIDIFGKNDLPAIYILGPGIEDFEGQLLTRDFMRDPFFMQNVDREEFEMKMWLRGDLDEDFKKSQEEKKTP